jgi:hypothetical protein
LGYSGTISCRGSAYYDRGKGRIWMDRVTCTGSESRLSSCTFSGWARHSSVCDHSDDAGVGCKLYWPYNKPHLTCILKLFKITVCR